MSNPGKSSTVGLTEGIAEFRTAKRSVEKPVGGAGPQTRGRAPWLGKGRTWGSGADEGVRPTSGVFMTFGGAPRHGHSLTGPARFRARLGLGRLGNWRAPERAPNVASLYGVDAKFMGASRNR